MMLNEEDYWPAEMVNELKVLARKEKFNWNSVAAKLSALVASDSLPASDNSSFDITPKTCREAFARDYSKAPYNLNKKPSPMKKPSPVAESELSEEVKSQSSPSSKGIVELSAEDEEEASKFDFDVTEELGEKITPKGVEKVEPLPVTPGPDLTYEEVLENAERIEEENYRRKEEVFAKVAKLLMLDGYGEDESGEEISRDVNKPMNAMDAQVMRAFQEGRRKREEEKAKRKKQQADAEEWRKIKEDRERLRRRFDEGSEDAEGEAYSFSPGANNSKSAGASDSQTNEEAEKALYEHYVRSMIGAAGAPSSSAASDVAPGSKALQAASDSKQQVHQELYRQLIVDTIAAKYHNELSAVRDGTGSADNANAVAQVSSPAAAEPTLSKPSEKPRSGEAVNLGGGFLESDEFEEILASLEAEQAATAQQKGGERGSEDEEGSSDLADVLAILDAAAAGKGAGGVGADKANDDEGVAAMLREMASMEQPSSTLRGPASGKVLLRAGMGGARRPGDESGGHESSASVGIPGVAGADMPPPPPKQVLGGRLGTSTLQESKDGRGLPLGAPRGTGATAMGRGGSRGTANDDKEDEEDEEDSDDDADSNWKSRRAAAKAKAAKSVGGPAAEGGSGGANGVYGFGGASTGMYSKPKRGGGGAGVSVERSTDKSVPPPAQTLVPASSVLAPAPVPAEESKGEAPPSPPVGGSTPQREAAMVAEVAPRSGGSTTSSKSLTPDLGGTWSDVLTPPSAAAAAGGSGTNLANEVDAEAGAEDLAPVEVGAAVSVSSVGGGMLGGRRGGGRSKGKTPMMKK